MFCPECRSEFESWVSECPDCRVPLVRELPPEPSHEAPELREVFTTSDPDVLPVVTSALRAAEIPFWTEGETSVGLWPLGSGGGRSPSNLISARVLVAVDRWEEARALLEVPQEPIAGEDAELGPTGGEDPDEDGGAS